MKFHFPVSMSNMNNFQKLLQNSVGKKVYESLFYDFIKNIEGPTTVRYKYNDKYKSLVIHVIRGQCSWIFYESGSELKWAVNKAVVSGQGPVCFISVRRFLFGELQEEKERKDYILTDKQSNELFILINSFYE